MLKDTLFLLPPGFADNGRREFCPECAEIWGVLNYYPGIQPSLRIYYVTIDHPRENIVQLLGPGHHNAPTLVLASTSPVLRPDIVNTANGRNYIGKGRHIALYFAERYGIAFPRGTR